MKFETKIFYVMTHHLNENFHSEKSDQASLIRIPVFAHWNTCKSQALKLTHSGSVLHVLHEQCAGRFGKLLARLIMLLTRVWRLFSFSHWMSNSPTWSSKRQCWKSKDHEGRQVGLESYVHRRKCTCTSTCTWVNRTLLITLCENINIWSWTRSQTVKHTFCGSTMYS